VSTPDLLPAALLAPLLAYGPAPGVELIPYFLGLLAWVGLTLASVLLSPISALLRRLRGGRRAPPAEAASDPKTAPEQQGEGRHERV
jgi:hypothetical protein